MSMRSSGILFRTSWVNWGLIEERMKDGVPKAQDAVQAFLKENPMWGGTLPQLDSYNVIFRLWRIPEANTKKGVLSDANERRLAVIARNDIRQTFKLIDDIREIFSAVNQGFEVSVNGGIDNQNDPKGYLRFRVRVPVTELAYYQKGRQSP